jgi:hypothetical protein
VRERERQGGGESVCVQERWRERGGRLVFVSACGVVSLTIIKVMQRSF